MTIDEKLNHFLQTCTEDVTARSTNMLNDYKTALEKTFAEHQDDANRRATMQFNVEIGKIEHEMNKKLSIEQIAIKRTIGQKQEELKEMLFIELKDKLDNFLATTEYLTLLRQQIKHAVEFAGDDQVIVYLDPSDEIRIRDLGLANPTATMRISEYSFGGGCRAVIPARHILIDHSFESKLADAQEKFHFDLSLTTGGTN